MSLINITHIVYSGNILASFNEEIMIQFLNSVLTMLARIGGGGAGMIKSMCNFQINVQCSIVLCICTVFSGLTLFIRYKVSSSSIEAR